MGSKPKWGNSVGTFLMGISAFGLLAASAQADVKPPTRKAPRCSQRDTGEIQAFDALVKSTQAKPSEFKTVDSFIAKLPESMRKNMIFMTQSRSIQAGTVANPRVILKSPNSDLTLSFNTDPNSPGYDSVEVVKWNAATKKSELIELRFPGDSKDPQVKDKLGPIVESNPAKCKSCHEDNRHVWDTYRFWPGQTPFAEDTLHKGSIEVDWYKKFLRDISSGKPRMKHLKPANTIAEIDKGLNSPAGRFQLDAVSSETTQGNNSPALDMSHQLLEDNGCRIGQQLKDRKDWDQIKYAAAGALGGCTNISEFLDPAASANAAKYFESRGVGVKAGKFDMNALSADTLRRQRSLSLDKEGRQFWQFEQNAPKPVPPPQTSSYDWALNQMEIVRKGMFNNDDQSTGGPKFATFENSPKENTSARYLLEPLGVPVNRWSMAADPGSYAHNQFFDEIYKSPAVQDVVKQVGGGMDPLSPDACKKLADLSKGNIKVTALMTKASTSAGDACWVSGDVLATEALKPIAGFNRALASSKAGKILDNECAFCHASGAGGAPIIPFGNLPALEAMLAKTQGKTGDLGARIWDRLTRSSDGYGQMPQGMGSLKNDDKLDVRRWLDSLPASSP